MARVHICRGKKDNANFSHLFVPVPVKIDQDDINVEHIGAELGGEINKDNLLKVLNKFYQRMDIRQLAKEHGLDRKNSWLTSNSPILQWWASYWNIAILY